MRVSEIRVNQIRVNQGQVNLFQKHLFLHQLTPSLSSLGVPWHTQIFSDQLTLIQPGEQIMPT